MGWGNKEIELPDELKGKSSQEIKDFLAAQAKEIADAKALATTAAAEAASSKSEFEKTKEKLASLEANRREPVITTRTEPAEKTSFLVDEDAAFNERVAPVVAFTLATAAMTARMTAMNSIPVIEKKLFDKYLNEVEGLMAKEAPERKANPQTWLNAWTYVKGLHTQELVTAAQKGDNAFFVEGVQSSGNVNGNQNVETKDELTTQELDIAKKMKISPEAFLARKKGIQVYVG